AVSARPGPSPSSSAGADALLPAGTSAAASAAGSGPAAGRSDQPSPASLARQRPSVLTARVRSPSARPARTARLAQERGSSRTVQSPPINPSQPTGVVTAPWWATPL